MKIGSFLVTYLSFWEYNADGLVSNEHITRFQFHVPNGSYPKEFDHMASRLKRDCVASVLTVHSDLLGREV